MRSIGSNYIDANLVDFDNPTVTNNCTFMAGDDGDSHYMALQSNDTGGYNCVKYDVTKLVKNNPGEIFNFKFSMWLSYFDTPCGVYLEITQNGTINRYPLISSPLAIQEWTVISQVLPIDTENITNASLVIYVNNDSAYTVNIIAVYNPMVYLGTKELEYGQLVLVNKLKDFKENINTNGKEITSSFDLLGVSYTSDDIVKINPYFDDANGLLGTSMKCLEIEMQSLIPVAIDTKLTNLKFGVKSSGDYDYINFGTYIVNKYEWDIETNSTTLLCYDKMIQSMIPYDLTIDYSSGNVTVLTLLRKICERLGWTLGTSEFTNSNVVIDEEKYDSTYTFRSVLEEIGQVAGGKIAFRDDDILYVLYPTETNETIDESNLKTLTIGKKYGPVNSLVIARTPQEDNIYRQDESMVEQDGVIEIKIENNQLMDSHREDFIDNLFTRLKGLTFYTYELESYGIGYLELYDLFTLKTHDNNEYSCLFLYDNLEITQGLSENSKAELPGETETDYKVASESDRVLNKTILQVDKQEQEIRALITNTQNIDGKLEGLNNGYSEITKKLEQTTTATQVQTLISETLSNGVDSVTTTTGYTFDKDGLTISKSGEEMKNLIDNTGMYVKRDDENILSANNEGVNAINLTARQYLTIGNNSRLEDYKQVRTACFYVGGDN